MDEKMTNKTTDREIYIWRWLLGVLLALIIVYPFLFLGIGELLLLFCGDLQLKELYTFGLPLNEFMTPWIALWGVLGAAFNIWFMQRRVAVMEKQREDQHKLSLEQKRQFDTQIEKQNEQIEIQQKQQRDARFASGVELLGNTNESTRIGGAYNLYFLANEFEKEYRRPVCEILCAHVRSITSKNKYRKDYKDKPSNEILTILNFLFVIDKNDELIFNDCYKNLDGVYLSGADLSLFSTLNMVSFVNSTLDNVKFIGATLKDVLLTKASLSYADFSATKLINVQFTNTTLSDVKFSGAILSEVSFEYATLGNVKFTKLAKLDKVKFMNATLYDSCFTPAILEKVNFSDATLHHINFCGSNLSIVQYRSAIFSLEGVFNQTNLRKVDFSGAKFECDMYFEGTFLENRSHEEITSEGRSLELTTPKE
jgi:uncharacterized protein YjbI with pentapeptide repeats